MKQYLETFAGPSSKDDLYLGVVEDNVDPKRVGRVKVRVQSMFDTLDVADIPWAHPYKDQDGKSFKIPSIGKLVNVVFIDDLHSPYYIYCEHYNFNLLKKLQSLSDDDYKAFSAVYFDDVTQIFTDKDRLMIDYMFNQIEINKGSIMLNLKNSDQKIILGGTDETIILANKFLNWLDQFVQTLLNPTSLIGNLGMPVLKPEIDALLSQYQSIRSTFTSKHIKVTDNYTIPKNNENMRDIQTSVVTDDQIKYNLEPLISSGAISSDAASTMQQDFKDKKDNFNSSVGPQNGDDQTSNGIYNITQGVNNSGRTDYFAVNMDNEFIDKVTNDLEDNDDSVVDDDLGLIYTTVQQNGYTYTYNPNTKQYE
jgi:hypothetical protein